MFLTLPFLCSSIFLPLWPQTYHLRGTWEILSTHVREPVLITTDLLHHRQSESFYSGLNVNIHDTPHNLFSLQQTYRLNNISHRDCVIYNGTRGQIDFIEYLPRNDSDWNYTGIKPINGIPCHFWRQLDPNNRGWYYEFYVNSQTFDPVRYLSIGQRNLHTHPTDYIFDIEEWGPSIDEFQFLIPSDCEKSTDWRFRRGITPLYGPFQPQNQSVCNLISWLPPVPDNLDDFSWRSVPNVLPPVRDQAICGSCWSHGSSEAISAQIALKTLQKTQVSAQQVIDCTWGRVNYACDGGNTWEVFGKLADRNITIVSENEYPYVGIGGECPDAYQTNLGFVIDRNNPCTQFAPNSTVWPNVIGHDLLKSAVYLYGPITVSIRAGISDFFLLSPENPWFSNPDGCDSKKWNENLDDHIVLLTGWTKHDGKSYLEIQNSWSENWGLNGFGYIDEDYDCGIWAMAVIPHIKQV